MNGCNRIVLQLISTMKKPQRYTKTSQQQPQMSQQRQIEDQLEQQQVVNQQLEQQPQQQVGDIDNQQESQQQQLEIDHQEYKQKLNNKGVCYLSRIPPYMKPNYIRKLLEGYMVQRIYLLAESDWTRKNRIKKGGNKKICFRQGWIQFGDKRMAKMAALTLNGQKMVSKKGNFYSQDVWNLKYLAKFKWHHLTQRLAHEQRLKKERLKVELEMERKVDEFYTDKLAKSKQIEKIMQSKVRKGREVDRSSVARNFQQIRKVQQIKDA